MAGLHGFTRGSTTSGGHRPEPAEVGAWSLRVYHKPFVQWIWLGAVVMALGGLLAATDRRYRVVKEAARAARVGTVRGKLAMAGRG